MEPGCKIILVDDDSSVLRCYDRLLRRSGFVPVATTDPQWLLDHLGVHGDADLLVFDFQMPKMNGITLLDRLRKRGFLAPALLVSALTSREVRERARRLGVVGILEKPVSTRMLLERIRKVVGAGRGDALAGDASPSTLAG